MQTHKYSFQNPMYFTLFSQMRTKNNTLQMMMLNDSIMEVMQHGPMMKKKDSTMQLMILKDSIMEVMQLGDP